MSIAVVIRAGGSGTRLWPISTRALPKQFLPILSEKTLLQETWQRVLWFGAENIFVTANREHADLVRTQLPELLPDHLLLEPAGRNTGPAMALETAALAKILPPDTVVASVPADDFVSNAEAFANMVQAAAAYLVDHREHIILPVVTPSYLDIGFSYLQAELPEVDALAPITDWVEKPDLPTCAKMLASGDWFAHAGMYVWTLETAVHAFTTLAPDAWHVVQDVLEMLAEKQNADAARLMNELPFISIESLITKTHPHKTAYLADALGWSDVGKWPVVKNLLPAADAAANVVTGAGAHFLQAENNLVYSLGDKKIVCVGVHDLLVVEGKKYILICAADQAAVIGDLSKKLDV